MDDLLDQIPGGLLTLTKEGRILSINHTLLELLEYQQDEVMDQHINVLLAESAKAFMQLYFFPLIMVKHRVEEMYLSLESRGGEGIPVLMNASFKQHNGKQTIICIMIPMQKRNEYEDQLLIAKKSATDAFDDIRVVNTKLEKTLKALEENEQKIMEINRQNEKYKTNIQNELKLAMNIQEKSLPIEISNEHIETASYYLASRELSGDIYGCYQINEHQYGIIILDVMGHGISSALITMSLQSLFEMLISKGMTTEIVMKELDHHLHNLFQNNADLWHYSTGICLIIDTDKQTIECTNAGHPAAIFQDASGEQIELSSTSPPIGTFEDIEFETETIRYHKGSRMLLYTDGVSEPLESERLGSLLKQYASEPLFRSKEGILQAIEKGGKGKFRRDDQCFILIDLK